MGNLIVGVDADGVLVDMSAFNIRDGKKFFKKEPVNPDAYSPMEIFGVTKEEEFKFGLKYFLSYINKEPARENASLIINKLNEEGYELHEITARKFTTMNNWFGEYNRNAFIKWLDKNEMQFKSIQFCSEENTPIEKLIACIKLLVDVMVEDKPDVALFLAQNGIKVLLFDAPYNQELNHPNMIRVYNWDQVYERISELDKMKEKYADDFSKKTLEEIIELSKEEKRRYFDSYRKYLKKVEIDERSVLKGRKRFKLLYNIGLPFVKAIFNPIVINKENVPYQNGFIIACNHETSNDQYLISTALKGRSFTGFASSTIEKTFRGRLFKFINGSVFIDRADSESKQKGTEELATRIAHDQIGLIFPEGTRKNKNEEGRKKFLLEFKLGTVSIAQKTGAPILPMAISYGKKYSLVRVGTPIFVKSDDDLIEKNQELYESISNLKNENIEYMKQKKKVK